MKIPTERAIRRLARWLGALATMACASGCSVFELGSYSSFGDWYVGPPGLSRCVGGTSTNAVHGDRPVLYGHFRTPELLLQPVGGWTYPERDTMTNTSFFDMIGAGLTAYNQARATVTPYTDGHGTSIYTHVETVEDGPRNSIPFDWGDGGLVEALPYRTYASDESAWYKLGITLMQPLNLCGMVLSDVCYRGPALITHDVLKTVMIPVAAIYYAGGDEEPAPAAASNSSGQ